MPHTILNLTSQPVPFTVRRVTNGEQYGQRGCFTHDQDDALIEFYDQRHVDPHSVDPSFGQFVSRYYESTLLSDAGKRPGEGLNLEGRVPGWSVDGVGMQEVIAWIRSFQEEEQSECEAPTPGVVRPKG